MGELARRAWAVSGLVWLWACAEVGSGAAAGGTGGASEPAPIVLHGAVQKGPFVIGSSVSVSVLNDELVPTGQVFNTQTNNDRGQFEISVAISGPVSLQGEGFYFNEVTGSLSGAALTLRAFFAPDQSSDGVVFINMLTHLTASRIRALVGDGLDFGLAVPQAEQELLRALNITGAGYEPAVRGISMDVTGEDTADNAYLLALSATLTHAAVRRGGAIDAALQELLNAYASDFADDGDLTPERKAEVSEALRHLQVSDVEAKLAARLQALGGSAAVPSMRRVLDTSRCCQHGTAGSGCRQEAGGLGCDPGLACVGGAGCEAWPEGCCVLAGAEGQACLPDGSCNEGLACASDPLQRIGWCATRPEGEPCCIPGGGEGQPCYVGGSCDPGLACVIQVPSCVGPCCTPAGGEYRPCLADGRCDPGLVCSLGTRANRFCNTDLGCCLQPGGAGQPCFADGTCSEGLVCRVDTSGPAQTCRSAPGCCFAPE
jgi:hypothetical protein